MQFSVLMAVYNKENPLRFERALQSNLEEQTVKPTQFVLVCDGALTETLDKIIEKYQTAYGDNFKVCRLTENVGLGRALNYGLAECAYDLVVRADSDDVSVANRFEIQTKFMEENPDVAASSGTIEEFIDDESQIFQRRVLPLTHTKLLKFAKQRSPLNHMATAFRKKDIVAVGSYQDLCYAEDYYLWARLLAAGKKLGNVEDCLVRACVGNGMMERRNDKRHFEGRRFVHKYMKEQGLMSACAYRSSVAKMWLWQALPRRFTTWIYRKVLRK